MTAAHPWWGPWFPDYAGPSTWFGPWFPDGVPPAGVITPPTPGGAATFLLLQSGSKITLTWATDVVKSWSGKEYRAALLDDPKRQFNGVATLLGDDTRTMRARLARYAAIGSTFLLALPFEAISITANSAGTVVPTTTTTKSDWMSVGQRVAVSDGASASIGAVIQAFTANSVTLDIDPGALGRNGCIVMPTVPIFFDPQMTFLRYRAPTSVENWNLNARAAVFGYPLAARAAFAVLSAASGALHSLVIAFPNSGPAANGFSLTFVADGAGVGSVTITTVTALVFHYQSGVTTVANLITALAAFNTFLYFGSYSPAATFTAGDAIAVVFANGALASNGLAMGQGATITTPFEDVFPLWDRGIQIEDSAQDSIQSLAELVDLGGLPISIGTAKQADWGRDVYLQRASVDDWQWLKKFLSTVSGSARTFWLPTFRADLITTTGPDSFAMPGVYSGGGSPRITVLTGEANGDIYAWYPAQRDRILIRQANGFVTVIQIVSIEDFGDGTAELTLDWFAHTLPDVSSPIDLVCWVDLCRFDADTFDITWSDAEFTFKTTARAVQQ